MGLLLGGSEQTLRFLENGLGEPLSLRSGEAGEAQDAPLLGHCRGGIRPGKPRGEAQTVQHLREFIQRRAARRGGRRGRGEQVGLGEQQFSLWQSD